MNPTVEYDLGRTYKSKSGNREVTYRPDLYPATPWICYYNGSPNLYFAVFGKAALFCEAFKDPLIIRESTCQ